MSQPHQSFDWRTHIRDPKTSRIVRRQNYTYHVSKNGQQWIERDGKLYNPDGSEFKKELVMPKPVQAAATAAPVAQPVVATAAPKKTWSRRKKVVAETPAPAQTTAPELPKEGE